MVEKTKSIEISFSAQFEQRVFFTNDLFSAEMDLLASLIEPVSSRPTVTFCVDSGVVETRPDILKSIQGFGKDYSEKFSQGQRIEIIPGGESCKQGLTIVEGLLEAFHRDRLDRRSYVVAIGGGAVLDTVGLAASLTHRGIRQIRIATTTLAQADVSVGVKNAVNYFGQKNYLGAYAVPWAVINDTASLKTLSDRDFKAGFAEAVKVALLKDAEFFRQISTHAEALANREINIAGQVTRRAAELHMEHITGGGDPFELSQCRPLDFGHWSAHRLESLSDYQLTHGEAVAIGIAIDCVYSRLIGRLAEDQLDAILSCLTRLGFHLNHTLLAEPEPLIAGIEEFRRHMGGTLNLTILNDIAIPHDETDLDQSQLINAIKYVSRRVGCGPGLSGRR